jgi:hypothetical protein
MQKELAEVRTLIAGYVAMEKQKLAEVMVGGHGD